jgi:hypothetical protein
MHRILAAGLAVVLAMAVASCDADMAGRPGPASPPPSISAAAPARPAGEVPSKFVMDLVRDAAPDPVAALPDQLPVAPRAESWNAGILKRIAGLMDKTVSDGHFYRVGWYISASLASFNLPREAAAWRVNPPDAGSLTEACGRPRAGDDILEVTCARVFGDLMGAALSEHAAGDVAKAEAYYQRVQQADAAIAAWMTDGRNCYHDLPDFPHSVTPECVWALELRATYEGISARPDALVRTLLFAEAMPPRLRDRGELPDLDLFENVAEQLSLRGQLRPMARAAELILRAYPKLGYIVVSTSLFEAIDRQIYAGQGLANAVNLMAIAARMPAVYSHAEPVWRTEVGLALDCRAAAIRAQSPETRAEAAARFDEILARYENGKESLNTGYCLYRLAPVVGRTDARARILAVMKRRQREVAAEQERAAKQQIADDEEWGQKLTEMFGKSAAEVDEEARHPNAAQAYIEAAMKSAGPWTLFAIDNEEYKAVLLANLNLSKAIPQNGRSTIYKRILWMVVANELYQPN